MQPTSSTLAVLYEHPEWFKPLFAELDRRGIPFDRVLATELDFDPSARAVPYALVLNRMSPSAYLRGHERAIFSALSFLRHVEIMGVPVVNGAGAYGLELSKSAQISLLSRLGVPHPPTRVINAASHAVAAAERLALPVVIKPNIGGSGAKIQRFDTLSALEAAATGGTLDLGIDHTALVQEYHPPVGGAIVRVEVLDGRFLYAIKVYPDPTAGFNLCPADICRTDEPAQELPADFCPVDLPRTNLKVEGYTPPPDVINSAIRIATAGGLDIGGIEYLISERDGRLYFYDINALSNFVTDAPRVVGFDPFPVFVDYLERRAAPAHAGVT